MDGFGENRTGETLLAMNKIAACGRAACAKPGFY
jgi:hypothetical protein